MASKWVKVSDSGSRVIVDSKRKQASHIVRASNRALTIRPRQVSLSNNSRKRKRDYENCKSKHCSSFTKTLLINYSNFMRSGPPQRLLFWQNDQWNDFSKDVIVLVKEDFLAKKAAIEVKFNGRQLMLDILHMIELDLKTGVQKPIAWIDDKGTCFFPELYSSCHESHHETLKSLEHVESESSMTPEVKLNVEIELNGVSNNNFEECVGESNVKRLKVDQEAHTNCRDRNLNDSCNRLVTKAEKVQQIDEVAPPICETFCKTMDQETVKNMFIKSLTPGLKVDIIDVKKSSGWIMEARRDLFQTQVESTQKLRGNANVRYAWFASPTDLPSSSLMYGCVQNGLKLGRYGYGVHLTTVYSGDNRYK